MIARGDARCRRPVGRPCPSPDQRAPLAPETSAGSAAQQNARDEGPQYTATATVLYADELVINLSTAKALGLTIPPSLLLRADQVIE